MCCVWLAYSMYHAERDEAQMGDVHVDVAMRGDFFLLWFVLMKKGHLHICITLHLNTASFGLQYNPYDLG